MCIEFKWPWIFNHIWCRFLRAERCSCSNVRQRQSGGGTGDRRLLLSLFCRESAFFLQSGKNWRYVVSRFQNTSLQQIRLDDDASVNMNIRQKFILIIFWKSDKIHYSSSSGIFIGIRFRQYEFIKDLKLFQNKIKLRLFSIKLKWYIRLHNAHNPSTLNSNVTSLLSLSSEIWVKWGAVPTSCLFKISGHQRSRS